MNVEAWSFDCSYLQPLIHSSLETIDRSGINYYYWQSVPLILDRLAPVGTILLYYYWQSVPLILDRLALVGSTIIGNLILDRLTLVGTTIIGNLFH